MHRAQLSACVLALMLGLCVHSSPVQAAADETAIVTPDGGRYVGPLVDGKFQGKGRLAWSNGSTYEGEFKQGLFSGPGRFLYSTGDVYEGNFEQGMQSGMGEFRFKDGRRYIGAFAQDLFEGKGRMEIPSGPVYEGDFAAGEFAGHGVTTFPGGARHEGQFLNWKPNGPGVLTDASGNRYEGNFKDGDLVGVARFTAREGSRYEGEFENWTPNGQGELHLSTGDVYKGSFSYGKFDGEGTMTYARVQPDGRKEDRGLWVYGRFKKTEDENAKRERANVETALYSQPGLLRELAGLVAPRDPASINLFLLAVAGDGSQEVFHREVEYVKNQFDSTYATRGHSLTLVNSRNTVATSAMATVTSIRQAVNALAAHMDRERDILFLYVSSHGSKDGEISLGLPGLDIPPLTPAELGAILKQAPVRWKVVVLSSCYAGTFINELTDPDTLIMTAARHDRRSFGCADENEFTYFGRAFFKEALPRATSFEDAFAHADRLIGEWENQDLRLHPAQDKAQDKDDAQAEPLRHSLPQLVAPPAIRDHLRAWWAQFPASSARQAGSAPPTFAQRVAVAKQLEEKKEVQDYFKAQMFPAIGPKLSDAMHACTGGKDAKTDDFSMVADIQPDGSLAMIDHEPKTITAVCVADAMATFRVPAPPGGGSGPMPIVLEMSARP